MTISAKWDELRTFGTSRLVQLTAVVPLIGYFLLLNDSLKPFYQLLFEDEPSVWRLYSLYFGFCFLGVASLLFSWRCPSEIKQHGAAYEFVDKQKDIMHIEREEEMIAALLRDYVEIKYGETDMLESALLYVDDVIRNAYIARTNDFSPSINLSGDPPPKPSERSYDMSTFANLKYNEISDRGRVGVMRDYFVMLKSRSPRWRIYIFWLYIIGFVLVGAPALFTFAAVVWHLVKNILGI